MTAYNYVTVISAVLLIILILLQTRGAGLGAGMGGGGEVNTVRRGSDLSIHRLTILLAITFAGSILASIVG